MRSAPVYLVSFLERVTAISSQRRSRSAGRPCAGCAARLGGIEVAPVASAGRIGKIRTDGAIGGIVDVDAIAETVIRRDVECRNQYTGNNAQ